MQFLRLLRQTLLEHFMKLELRGKVTVSLLAGALVLGALVMLASYLMFRNQLVEHTHAQLNAEAALEQRKIELRLGSVITLAESLASNTVTANALADSRGRETYLDPLLRSQRFGVAGADVTITDYRGRAAASTLERPPDFQQHPIFLAMMSDGVAKMGIESAGTAAARLVFALPIRYLLTNNVEGSVMLRVPLEALLDYEQQELLRITDADGKHLVGHAPAHAAFEQYRPLRLPKPVDAASLQVVVARDANAVFRKLDALLYVFLGLGVMVVAGVVLFAQAAARFIARPLGELADAAEKMAAAGRPAGQLPVRSVDEFGRLSTAFNTMVVRLRESYQDLEQRVVERTREFEKSRREAESAGQLLREAVQSIAVGFSIFDPHDRLVMCNEAYRCIYEKLRDMIVPGISFERILQSIAAKGLVRDPEDGLDQRVTTRMERHRHPNGIPIEQQLADGRWLLIIEHRTPDGYIVSNVIDITEQHAAEARIRDRTEQLNAIFALSPDAFVSFDAQRCVKYVSPAFQRMTGLSEGSVIGLGEEAFSKMLTGLCSKTSAFPGLAKLRQNHRRSEDTYSEIPRHLIELNRGGGQILEVGVRLSDAETVSQILYLRDVTHETEVDRMKSEFLSTAAHELRTPMASIFGFSELLLSGRLTEAKKQESLNAIYRQSRLMISIVNELLDLARIDARRGKDFELQRIDLNELLREACANFQAPDERPAPILLPIQDPPTVRADRLKLMQTIGNVLSNAYKYSPEGGDVTLDLITEPQGREAGQRIGIRVADRGIGMSPEQLQRVGERFYRADTSGGIPGTGLGMSIVKEIIELHGGEMVLQSAPGAGTTVTLWLPVADAHSIPSELPCAAESPNNELS